MTAPSLVRLARTAPDAGSEILRMARHMVHMKNSPEGACTIVHLFQAGFTEAQVVAYRDPARAMLKGLPLGLTTDPPGRREAQAAADAAMEIKVARIAERMLGAAAVQSQAPARPEWAPPVVREMTALGASL